MKIQKTITIDEEINTDIEEIKSKYGIQIPVSDICNTALRKTIIDIKQKLER